MTDVPGTAALLVRACWDLGLRVQPLRPAPGAAFAPRVPVLERPPEDVPALHLPDATIAGGETIVTAAAMHAAAHLRFGPAPLDRNGLKPLQQAILGVLEDARVEMLAMHELPGLRRLWLSFHVGEAAGNSIDALLQRLARALMDPAFDDPHPWVDKARRLFHRAPAHGMAAGQTAHLRQAASLLGNDLGQMRLQFNASAYLPFPGYRDDNAHLWQTEERTPEDAPAILSAQAQAENDDAQYQGLRRHDSAGQAAASHTRGAQANSDTAAETGPESGVIPVAAVAEWDRLCMRYRADWCQVFELVPSPADPGCLADSLQTSRARIARAAALLRAAGRRGRFVAASADGEEFMTDRLIAGAVALRAARMPEPRIYRNPIRRPHAVEVHLVIDTSVSTAAIIETGQASVALRLLDAMKTACALACAALEDAGIPCSLTGYSSNTRHHLRIQPVKALDESLHAEGVLPRLAGLVPQWSTRTGAVLRHIAAATSGTKAKRLLVLLTDGEPYDIDVHDPAYLEDDLRRAVREAAAGGAEVVSLHAGAPAGAADGRRARARTPEQMAAVVTLAVAERTE